jgi:hypothetical protein
MKPKLLLLVAIVAFASAVAGVFLGRYFSRSPRQPASSSTMSCTASSIWMIVRRPRSSC